VAANVMERITMNKVNTDFIWRGSISRETRHKVKSSYPAEASSRFAPLEDFGTDVDIKSAREIIRENITRSAKENLCYYELKKHVPWFNCIVLYSAFKTSMRRIQNIVNIQHTDNNKYIKFKVLNTITKIKLKI
jgi:hypothetical protein